MARGRHFVQDLWASCTPADPLVLWRSGPALQAAHVPQPEHPRGNAACCTLQERGRQFETRQGQPRCTCEAVTRARLSCSQYAASCLQGVDVRECCAHAFQCTRSSVSWMRVVMLASVPQAVSDPQHSSSVTPACISLLAGVALLDMRLHGQCKSLRS